MEFRISISSVCLFPLKKLSLPSRGKLCHTCQRVLRCHAFQSWEKPCHYNTDEYWRLWVSEVLFLSLFPPPFLLISPSSSQGLAHMMVEQGMALLLPSLLTYFTSTLHVDVFGVVLVHAVVEYTVLKCKFLCLHLCSRFTMNI